MELFHEMAKIGLKFLKVYRKQEGKGIPRNDQKLSKIFESVKKTIELFQQMAKICPKLFGKVSSKTIELFQKMSKSVYIG